MKKLLFTLCSLALITALPAPTLAAEFRSGDSITIEGTTINENLYIGGGQVNLTSPVSGDVFIAGGNISVSAPIKGDLFIAGGDIAITGPVSGDVRVGGGNVSISSSISGELLVGAGQVTLSSQATAGQVWAGTGQLTIAGKVGQVTAGVGKLTIAESATINGNLTYTSENEATISPQAAISGETTRHIPPVRNVNKKGTTTLAGTSLIGLISSYIMLILLMYAMPNKVIAIGSAWRQNFASNLLWGVIGLVVTPIVVVLLLISVIGVPLALITMVLYIIGLYFANLLTIMAIGSWLRSIWIKKPAGAIDWLSPLLGLATIAIVSIIPIVGAAAIFVAFIAGLGTLIRHDWNLYNKLKKSKDL